MASLLESLRKYTTVVADTGDFESMKRYQPTDATTNPSLILKAVQQDAYRPMLARCVNAHPKASSETLVDQLLVAFGKKFLALCRGEFQQKSTHGFLLTRGLRSTGHDRLWPFTQLRGSDANVS